MLVGIISNYAFLVVFKFMERINIIGINICVLQFEVYIMQLIVYRKYMSYMI